MRKHQTWLWIVIITLTVISFVIYFSPTSKLNTGGREANLGSINGERVTRQQFSDALREVTLHHLFMTGRWPDEDRKDSRWDSERETYQWLLLVQKERQFGVRVGEEAAAQTAQQMLRALDRSGQISPKLFAERVLAPRGMDLNDFERYARHFVGIQELVNTFGASGKLITPQEAKALYEREHQEMATEVVTFSATNFLASVQPSPEAISQFYSNRANLYAIPERVQVNYVKFNVTNFLSQAESKLGSNINDVVEQNFNRLGTNYFADAKTPAEAKAKIRQELFRSEALSEARKQALDFANELFAMTPVNAQDLQKLAQKKGLTVQVTAPFNRDDGPQDLPVGPDFTKAAFGLNAEEPYAGPIPGQDGVYVISANKTIPREVPPLAQIRDRVTTDYKLSQARELAWRASTAFHQTVTNALAQGKSFADACAQGNVKPVELPPFSLSTRTLPGVEDLNQLKQAAFSASPGKAANGVVQTGDGGLVLYVKAKLPLDQTKLQADLPTFVAALRRTRQQEAFDDWMRREMEKGLRDIPAFNRPTPPNLAPSAKS